jgi:hypothetical protein
MLQPIILEDNISIAANSVNDNVIASNSSLRRYLRSPFAGNARFAAVQSATGLRVSVDYGSKNVIDASDMRVGTDLQEPYDVINNNFHPSEGDQLVVRVANTTGGALSIRYRLVIEPVAEPGTPPSTFQLPPDSRVTQRGPVNIASAAIDVQQLSGIRYERAPANSLARFLMSASAAGLTRQLFVDQDSIAPPSSIPPTNRVPQDPLDQTISGVEVERDRQVEMSITNPTGGALNVFWRYILDELERA